MSLNSYLRQAILKQIAIASIGIGGAAHSVHAALCDLPLKIVEQVLDEAETDWEDEDRMRLLGVLARHPMASIRRNVALEVCGTTRAVSLQNAVALLAHLAKDRARCVRSASVAGLRAVLAEANALERTHVTCEWATSDSPAQRYAIARAISAETCSLGTVAVIDLLADDVDPTIRRAAITAAEHMIAFNKDFVRSTVTKRLSDEVPAVRKAARRALRKLQRCADASAEEAVMA